MQTNQNMFSRFILVLMFLTFANMCMLAHTPVSFAQGGCSPGIPCIVGKESGQNAPKTDSETCDADFMNQIYARSFLEAEREIVMNSTVFRKPDSVLEYSCFDQFVSIAAHKAGPLFSETDRFNGIEVIVSVGGGLGAFLSADGVSAVAGLDAGALGEVLPTLSTGSLIDVLNETPLNVLEDLNFEQLVGPLADIASADLAAALAGLPQAVQDLALNKFQDSLPAAFKNTLGDISNLEGALSSLKTLDPTAALNSLQNATSDGIANVLNVLPQNVLTQFDSTKLTSTLTGLGTNALSDTLGSLTNEAISALPTGVIQNTLGSLSTPNLTSVLGGLSATAAAALPVNELTAVLKGLPVGDVKNLLNGLDGKLVNALPAGALVSTFNNFTPAQLTESLNSLSADTLKSITPNVFAQTFGNLSPQNFAQVANNFSTQTLTSISPAALTATFSSFTSFELSQTINGLSADVQKAIPVSTIKNTFNNLLPTDAAAVLKGFSANTIKNLAPASLTEAFGSLAKAGTLAQTLNSFDPVALAAVPATALVGSLSNSTAGVFNTLTADAQGAITQSITNSLPTGLTGILGSGQTAITSLQNLSPEALVANIPSLNPAEVTALLNITPTSVLNNLEFVPGGLAGALKLGNFSTNELAGIVSNFSGSVIDAIPKGEFTEIFSGFNTDNLLQVFGGGLSLDAIKNFTVPDLQNILSLPNIDLGGLVEGLGGDVLSSFNSSAFTNAFQQFGDFGSLIDDLNGDKLLDIFNNFNADFLPEALSFASGGTLDFLGGGISGSSLGSAFSGLGGGLFGSGGTVTVPLNVFLGDTKLDISLEVLVLQSLKSYVDTNFTHDFLGGSAFGLNNEISASIGSDSYTCQTMDQVWFLAKCRNFALDDSFLSFEDLTVVDPRILPEECAEGPTITQGLIDLAHNKDFVYVDFAEVINYFDLLIGGACTDPIPTGVPTKKILFGTDGNAVVTGREEIFFNDHVCSNPGCYYDFEAGACR